MDYFPLNLILIVKQFIDGVMLKDFAFDHENNIFAEYPDACIGDEGERRTLRSSNLPAASLPDWQGQASTQRSEVFERR